MCGFSDGGPRRHEGPRSEVEIIADLAAQRDAGGWARSIGRRCDRRSRIREAISKIVPGFEQIGEIDHTKQEFRIPGRTLHEPVFPTANGRAKLHVHELPELAAATDAAADDGSQRGAVQHGRL